MSCRAEKRSVIRRSAFAPPWRLRQPRRWMADDGLRPFPPYVSFIIEGGRWPRQLVGSHLALPRCRPEPE
ncbi:hypothetical protein [Thioalkalivibrio paradoxus]|uniref:hypothetical protein n=1 Tax=Thioalkalivibrio paradoxus TaxID=108010 RepID=UPI000A00EED5|nr:hypothetical protein [Thioalkalivibrio paradoxus]